MRLSTPLTRACSIDNGKVSSDTANMTSKTKKQKKSLDLKRSREKVLEAEGKRVVAGVDEAGIGPLAGPVVAAAVVLPEHFSLDGIDDSKKLSAKRREKLFPLIQEEAVAFAISIVDIPEIDELNIYHAGLLAMRRAVEALHVTPNHLLVDGRVVPDVLMSQTRIVGGDAEELSIAAASVLAKETRDRLMRNLDNQYPEYGFAGHKGYPTKVHQEALAKHGPCPAHRMSFGAVRDFAGLNSAFFRSLSNSLEAVKSEGELKEWRKQLKDDRLSAGEVKRLRGLAQRYRLSIATESLGDASSNTAVQGELFSQEP